MRYIVTFIIYIFIVGFILYSISGCGKSNQGELPNIYYPDYSDSSDLDSLTYKIEDHE